MLEAMREGGYAVGGEQSGHMILLEHNSTGDGLVTACQFLAAVRRSGKPVEEAIKVMTKFPQTLINVRVKDKHALEGNAPFGMPCMQLKLKWAIPVACSFARVALSPWCALWLRPKPRNRPTPTRRRSLKWLSANSRKSLKRLRSRHLTT